MENDIIVKTLKATRNINSFFDRERNSANPSLAESEIRLAAIKERVLLYCSKLSAKI